MKTRKPNLFAALATLTCAALAVLTATAGLWPVSSLFTGAAVVWSWNL